MTTVSEEIELLQMIHEDRGSDFFANLLEMITLYAVLRESREDQLPINPGETRNIKTSVIELNTSGKECSVCLDEFKVGDIFGKLPCKHMFHEACIKKWFEQNNSCPICRMGFPREQDG